MRRGWRAQESALLRQAVTSSRMTLYDSNADVVEADYQVMRYPVSILYAGLERKQTRHQ